MLNVHTCELLQSHIFPSFILFIDEIGFIKDEIVHHNIYADGKQLIKFAI